MHILHLVHQYLPEDVGGTELYTQSLARLQVEQGHEVSIFYPSSRADVHPFQQRNEEGVRVFAAPVGTRSRTQVFLSSWRQPAIGESLAALLARIRPDLVHVQHLMGLPTSAIDQVRAAGIPQIVTLHDYWYVCPNAQLLTNYDRTVCEGPAAWINCGRCVLARAGLERGQWLAPAIAPLLAQRAHKLQQVLAGAAALIAPTRFVAERYRRLGVAQEITVIPHGIHVPRFVQEAPRSVGPRKAGTLRAVYVGGIARQKGVHVLVEAARQLAPAEVQIAIYGDLSSDPAYVRELQAAAAHLPVRFGGPLDRQALWQMLLSEPDVLVVPSLWYETAALVIQEAFAAGVPVLASRLGALQERVVEGEDGLFFRPGDAVELRQQLRRLQADPALLRRLQDGIKPVRTMTAHAGEVEALYYASHSS